MKKFSGWLGLGWMVLSSVALARNDAAFVSQYVPGALGVGEKIEVEVTFRNTGDRAWTETPGALYRLGSQSPADNNFWGPNRYRLSKGEPVLPGQSRTFRFPIEGPADLTTIPFQWQMLEEFKGVFGTPSPKINVVIMGRNWPERLYSELMNRYPTTAEVEEIRRLFGKGLSAEAVALEVMKSADYGSTMIKRAYLLLMGHVPARIDQLKWMPIARNGGWRAVLAEVASTDEYFQVQGESDRRFVTGVYRDILKVEPGFEVEEKIDLLQKGKSRAEVADAIFNTDSFYEALAKEMMATHFKQYSVPPTKLAPILTRIHNGDSWEKIRAGLLASREYRLKSASQSVKADMAIGEP